MKKILLSLLALLIVVGASAQETDVTTLDWTQKGQGCVKDFNNPNGGTVFGTDDGGANLSYVDVSAYGQINLYGEPGQTARLFVNREEIGDKGIIYVDINEEGVGVYDFNNLLKLQSDIKYIHLNGVKARSWDSKLNLSKITVSGDPIKFPEPEPEPTLGDPIYSIDYTTIESFPFFVMGYTPEFNEDGLNSSNPGGWYQYFVADGINTEIGADYKVVAEIWCDIAGSFNANMGWGWGEGQSASAQVKVTANTWTESEFTFKAIGGNSCNIVFQPGGFNGVIKMKNIKVYKIVKEPSKYPFDATEADITTFDFNDAENYDLEIGKFTANGGWTFAEPKDFSHYKWLVVTTTYNASKAGGEFRIKDANGNSIGGEDYAKGDGVSRGSMWIDRWNNQICATVSMEYIASKGIDITKIAGVSFSANQPISAVYLTNYEAGQAIKNKSGWGSCAGDYIRECSNIAENGSKFGTIALKYAAAVSGAYVYTVDAFDPEVGMTLSRHYGVLEAGVPYIYEAIDEVGLNGEGANCNVNFFRVDENAVSGAWSDNAARDNGLIGYYDGGFGPGAGALTGCYIISQNQLHKITGGNIQLGTNRCFFDPAKCTNKSSAGVKAYMGFGGEETAIKDIEAKSLKSGKIYDINGREVKSMHKAGLYIMNGIKVLVK